jgi:hypothetical protein
VIHAFGRRPSACRHSPSSYQLFSSSLFSVPASFPPSHVCLSTLRWAASTSLFPGSLLLALFLYLLGLGSGLKRSQWHPKVTPKYAFLLLRLSLSVSRGGRANGCGFLAQESRLFFSLSSAWLGVSSPVSWRLCVWVCELPPLPCRWPVAGGLISGVLAQL